MPSMGLVEQIGPADLRPALAVLLAPPGDAKGGDQRQIAGFCDYLAQCPVRWEGLRCGRPQAPTALFFTLLLPGRTAIVIVATPGEHGINPDDQLRVTRTGLETLREHSMHYAQSLLEPDAVAKRALLEQVGFGRLAPLVYLERDATYPWVEPPQPGEAEWLRYSAHTHAEFAAVVLATYEDSRDCPELTGLRPIDDILAAHQAGGRFDPALWELTRIDGQPAACLLLSPLVRAPLLEVVYMGVVPAFRRRGIGKLLLRRALEQCRATGARQLTVVVDDRNEPAKRLYAQFALQAVARRDAYLYRWKPA
jgi:GNAT superfamily N-acetyltransferase